MMRVCVKAWTLWGWATQAHLELGEEQSSTQEFTIALGPIYPNRVNREGHPHALVQLSEFDFDSSFPAGELRLCICV